jgi:hypothetical protein
MESGPISVFELFDTFGFRTDKSARARAKLDFVLRQDSRGDAAFLWTRRDHGNDKHSGKDMLLQSRARTSGVLCDSTVLRERSQFFRDMLNSGAAESLAHAQSVAQRTPPLASTFSGGLRALVLTLCFCVSHGPGDRTQRCGIPTQRCSCSMYPKSLSL